MEHRLCEVKTKTNKNNFDCVSTFMLSLASMPGYIIFWSIFQTNLELNGRVVHEVGCSTY